MVTLHNFRSSTEVIVDCTTSCVLFVISRNFHEGQKVIMSLVFTFHISDSEGDGVIKDC